MSLPPPPPSGDLPPPGGALPPPPAPPSPPGAGATPPPFGLPPAIPELEGLKKDLTASIDYLVAWVALMIWDVVSTFPSEYRYVWKSDWSALKVLFFLNRYGSLVLQILNMSLVVANVSADFCSHFFWFTPLVTTYVLTLCGAIFAFRIYTLYDRNCKIRTLLLTSLGSLLGAMVSNASQFTYIEFDSAAREFLDFHGCMVSGKPGKSMAPTILFWTAPFCFSLLLLGLALYRSFTTLTVAGVKVSLIQAMLRDGIWYFSVPVAVNLCSVILAAQTANPNLHNFNAAGSIGLNFVMASRLMLSLFIHNASSTTSSGPHGSHESPRFVPTFPSNNFAAGPPSNTTRPRAPTDHDEEKIDRNLDIEAGLASGRIEMERKHSGTTLGDSRSIRSKASDGTFQITGQHGIEEEFDDDQNEKDARSGDGGREVLSSNYHA